MQALLTVAFPVFGIMACGFLARYWNLLEPSGVRSLNNFVFLFALPALLLIRVAEAPIDQLFDWRLVTAYYSTVVIIFSATVLLARFQEGVPLATASLQGLCTVWSNSGHLGIPLTITAFGADALLPTVLVLTFDNIVVAPAVFALIEGDPERRGAQQAVIRTVVSRLSRNPVIIAVVLGIALAMTHVRLPPPLLTFGELLGAGAAPCALFALGASLVGVPVAASGTQLTLLSLLKLVAHPLLVWLMVTFVYPADPRASAVLVMVAALPTGTSVFVFAQRYETYVVQTSSVILASHLGAVLTVSTVLVLLGAGG
jgi:predicted permease